MHSNVQPYTRKQNNIVYVNKRMKKKTTNADDLLKKNPKKTHSYLHRLNFGRCVCLHNFVSPMKTNINRTKSLACILKPFTFCHLPTHKINIQ